MTAPRPFTAQISVVLDGSGNGTVRLGPRNAGEMWTVFTPSISVSSNTNEPTFVLYFKNPAGGRRLGGSFSGSSSSDTSMNPFGMSATAGDYVTGIWTGGDAGATATLTLAVDRSYA